MANTNNTTETLKWRPVTSWREHQPARPGFATEEEYRQLRQKILAVLAPFPDARDALAAALNPTPRELRPCA